MHDLKVAQFNPLALFPVLWNTCGADLRCNASSTLGKIGEPPSLRVKLRSVTNMMLSISSNSSTCCKIWNISHSTQDAKLVAVRHPTLFADASHAHRPLHVQSPALPYLSWAAADDLVRDAASEGEKRLWETLSAAYRDVEQTRLLDDATPHSMSSRRPASPLATATWPTYCEPVSRAPKRTSLKQRRFAGARCSRGHLRKDTEVAVRGHGTPT